MDTEYYSKQILFKNMSKFCPDVADSLIEFSNSSINDYANYIWSKVLLSDSKISQNSRSHLYNVLFNEVEEQLDFSHANEALAEFIKIPVLQTGPHCQLLVERSRFYSAIFSLIGLNSIGHKYCFLENCSTVSFTEKANTGPGWITFHDTSINVFGLSRRTLLKSSVYAYNAPLSFELNPTLGKIKINKINLLLKELKELIGSEKFNSATKAFNKANHTLWRSWDKFKEFYPIFLDEYFFVKLLLSHLSDSNSIVYRILNDCNYYNKILSNIKDEAKLPTGSKIPHQTEFFWTIRKKKIHALVINDGKIFNENHIDELCFDFNITNIKKGLKEGILIPDAFMIILMLSILPNVRIVGGSRQIAYYSPFQRVFMDILNEKNDDELGLKEYLQKNFNSAWGATVLDENEDVSDLLIDYPSGQQLEFLIKKFSQQSLVSTTKKFKILNQSFC